MGTDGKCYQTTLTYKYKWILFYAHTVPILASRHITTTFQLIEPIGSAKIQLIMKTTQCLVVVIFSLVFLMTPSPTNSQANKAACLVACARGTAAIQAFCRVIPHPAVRAACWAVQFAGPVICRGFCYNNF